MSDTFQNMTAAVSEFHEKIGRTDCGPMNTFRLEYLVDIGNTLLGWSQAIELRYVRDKNCIDMRRFLRAHLLIEELGEFVKAIGEGDEETAADSLGDLLYVLIGSAIEMDLPLETLFWEIQRSNMTKEKQPDDPGKERVRAKGPNYKPPDIARVLREYRARAKACTLMTGDVKISGTKEPA